MRPNLDPPPPPKEDKGLVSSRAGYAFANLEGFLCIMKFVLDFFGVSGGDEVTAPARKSRKKLFKALLQFSLHPSTSLHQFTQNKITWCQSILSLFVTLYAPPIFTSGSKEFYLKDPYQS